MGTVYRGGLKSDFTSEYRNSRSLAEAYMIHIILEDSQYCTVVTPNQRWASNNIFVLLWIVIFFAQNCFLLLKFWKTVAFCAGDRKQQAIRVAVACRFLFLVALPTSGRDS